MGPVQPSSKGAAKTVGEEQVSPASVSRDSKYSFSSGVEQNKFTKWLYNLFSGADYSSFLHHFSSRTHLKGSWGQVCPKHGRQFTRGRTSRNGWVRPLSRAGDATMGAPGSLGCLRAESGVGPGGADFRSLFGQIWVRDPKRSTGFVLQRR